MPTLVQLTTYDEVRAVLGVSDVELSDDTLQLPIFETLWQGEMIEIYEGLPALLDDIMLRSSTTPPTVTSIEKQLLETVKVFSAYATSKIFLSNAQLFTTKKITDGRASVERFAQAFKGVIDGLNAMYRTLRNRIRMLLRLLGIEVPEPAAKVFLSTAGLAVNPITNE